MGLVTVSGDERIAHLDWDTQIVCEMKWLRTDVDSGVSSKSGCRRPALFWLTCVSDRETVIRRLACAKCVADCLDSGRLVSVSPIEW